MVRPKKKKGLFFDRISQSSYAEEFSPVSFTVKLLTAVPSKSGYKDSRKV